jgi:hypothetical protein
MLGDHPTGATAWLTTTDTPTAITLIIAALIMAAALITIADITARRLTLGARERARARAQLWAAHHARAARRRARVRARARAVATSFMDTPTARRALLALLNFTALAATVLSAHGIQDALTGAGLESWWVRVLGFAAFEGFMLTMFALSWWHITTSQDGLDIYGVCTWGGSIVLALVGYHGGGDWIYLVFAPLAAFGFHLTARAERRRRGGALSWAAKAAAAARRRFEAALVWLGRTPTSTDTNRKDRERRLNRVAARAVKAHRAERARAWRAWRFDCAVHAAQARGILDEAGRAYVAELVAARFGALDALAPAALGALGVVWGTPAAPAPEPAPAEAPHAPNAMVRDALERARAVEAKQAPARVDAREVAGVAATILASFKGDTERAVWIADYFKDTGELPTGRQLGEAFTVDASTGRRWLEPVKAALGAEA